MSRSSSRTGGRWLPGFVLAAQKECVSFFFTNFPQAENVLGLRKIFCSFGSVGDMFIPSKTTKFRAVTDVDKLLFNLQDIWLGTHKLRVNILKFGRNDPAPTSHCSSTAGALNNNGQATTCDGRSFVEILTNKERSLLGVASSHELPHHRLFDLCLSTDSLLLHGFHEISVCLMGGGLALISSKNDGLLMSLFDPAHDWWTAWFSKLEFWSPGTLSHRREVWLSVWGIPLQCWGLDLFVKISKSFGDFIMLDESTLKETSLIIGRVKVSLPVTASGLDELMAVVTSACTFSVRVLDEIGMLQEFTTSQRDRDSCDGGGSDVFVARSYAAAPSDDGFSDPGSFENGRDSDHQIEEASDRRREVSLSCHYNRDEGCHPSFLKSSKSAKIVEKFGEKYIVTVRRARDCRLRNNFMCFSFFYGSRMCCFSITWARGYWATNVWAWKGFSFY
ncbi:hypothetical protein TSUD_146000 [Trifolium subterraneum]|uniref:Uncharacterized protein n=1 Tax=Trifolium subterraneum TaxID=3900 RepID=A0A2Z6NQT9_TRISU|nr:hypothetical protein TSUD_146000 [Trifolium subterraneum]